MVRPREIHEELALHRVRGVEGPQKPENLTLDENGIAPAVAAEAVRLGDPGQREDAVKKINAVIRGEIAKCQIPGHAVNSVGEIEALVEKVDDGEVVLSAADANKLNDLKWIRWEAGDGMAVATLSVLSGSEEIAKTAKEGDATKTEKLLGLNGEAVGLGEAVNMCVVADKQLRLRLSAMQRKIAGGAFDNGMVVATLNTIEDLYARGEVDGVEAGMVMAYLSSIIGAEVAEKVAVEQARQQFQERQEQAFDAQQKLAERNLRLGEASEKTSYDDWLGTVLGKGGQAGLPGAIWTYTPPEGFRGNENDWHDWLDFVTSMSNKVLSRRGALGGAKSIGKAYYDINYPKVQERSVALAYNDSKTGFRRALETIASDLYVETITEEVDGKLVVRQITQAEIDRGISGQFVMRYGVVNGSTGRQILNQDGAKLMAGKGEGGRRAYVLRASELLHRSAKRDFGGEDHAKMAAAAAMDFLELGFGIDGTDHERKVNSAVEAARTDCRPGFKLGAKTEGGEVMLGAWVAFYQERYEDDIAAKLASCRVIAPVWNDNVERGERNKIIAEMARRDGLIPQVLCGSILDLDVDTAQGKMSMGRALQNRVEIYYNEGSNEDLLFPIDKWFENAADFWNFVSSAEKLQFKGELREVDAVIVDFAKGLNNAYADLRSRGLVDKHDLVAAIGGAAGLIPSNPPVLNVPFDNRKLPYEFIGRQLLQHMPALSSAERDYVFSYFGFNTKFAKAAPQVWKSSMDVGMNVADRQFFKDVLRKTGSSAARKHRALLE